MSHAIKRASNNLLPLLHKFIDEKNCKANICFNKNKIEVNLIWSNKKIKIADYCSSVIAKRLEIVFTNQ